jgi:hypothetical protein
MDMYEVCRSAASHSISYTGRYEVFRTLIHGYEASRSSGSLFLKLVTIERRSLQDCEQLLFPYEVSVYTSKAQKWYINELNKSNPSSKANHQSPVASCPAYIIIL